MATLSVQILEGAAVVEAVEVPAVVNVEVIVFAAATGPGRYRDVGPAPVVGPVHGNRHSTGTGTGAAPGIAQMRKHRHSTVTAHRHRQRYSCAYVSTDTAHSQHTGADIGTVAAHTSVRSSLFHHSIDEFCGGDGTQK